MSDESQTSAPDSVADNATPAAQSPANLIAEQPAKTLQLDLGGGPEVKPPAPEPQKPPAPDPAIAQELDSAVAKMKELEAVIADLRGNIDSNKSQIDTNKAAMRDSVLARLNVLDKYKSFAPDVDPFTDEGKLALETWASENPELMGNRPQPVVEVDTEKFKSNMRSPHLVDFATFAKSMKGG